MFPVLFSIKGFTLHTYGVLVALGVLIGTWLFVKEGKDLGLDEKRLSDLVFWAVLSGVISSRAFFVLMHLEEYRGDPLKALKIWEGGLVLYGGLLPALILASALMKRWGVPVRKTLDTASFPLAIGFALGRFGCLSAGCCYGKPTTLPWGIVFQDERSLAPLGVRLHPTQLYEALFFVLLALFLKTKGKRIRTPGEKFFTLSLSYGGFRFFNEFLRGDPRAVFWGLSHNQWVMVGLFVFSLIMLIYYSREEDPYIP